MEVRITKMDLPEVVEALQIIVHGEKVPTHDADGNATGHKTRRFKVRPAVDFTLGRAHRHLRSVAQKVQEKFTEDMRELFNSFAVKQPLRDGEKEPRMEVPADRIKEYRAEAARLNDELFEQTVGCPYTVRLSQLDLDDELPIGALGELVIDDVSEVVPAAESAEG